MRIDRIFSELRSRKFQFVIEGQKFSLPHLNGLKTALMEIAEDNSRGNRWVYLATKLIDPLGDPKVSEAWRELSLEDLEKLITEWFDWSGFSLGKF